MTDSSSRPNASPVEKGRFSRIARRVGTGTVILMISLVMLEIMLRIWIALHPVPRHTPPDLTNMSADRILCVGDSFTYGIGSRKPVEDSYPAQLQLALGPDVTVINEGWPGANSSMVRAYLPKWLNAYRPRIVLALVGVNNNYNPLGASYDELKKEGLIQPSETASFKRRIHRVMWNSVVYRWMYWTTQGTGARGSGDSPAAMKYLEHHQNLSEVGADGDVYHARSYDAWNRNRGVHSSENKAIRPYLEQSRQAFESDDLDFALIALNEAFSRVRGIEDFSEDVLNLIRRARAKASAERYEELLETLKSRLDPESYRLCTEAPFFLAENRDLGSKMLWYDLEKMQKIVREQGAELVLLTYPSAAYRELHLRFAEEKGAPILDTTFDPGWPDYDRLFKEPNGHLNAVGYKRLAYQLLLDARRQGFLKPLKEDRIDTDSHDLPGL